MICKSFKLRYNHVFSGTVNCARTASMDSLNATSVLVATYAKRAIARMVL